MDDTAITPNTQTDAAPRSSADCRPAYEWTNDSRIVKVCR